MENAHPNPMQHENRVGGEFYFIKIMAEEVEKGYTTGSTFNKQHQLYVYGKFRAQFGPLYSDRYLRSKLKLLEKRYLNFSEVLSHEGITWNKQTNIVEGNEEVLKAYKLKGRNGRYYGEEHYDLLRQIFESGVNFE